MRHTSGRQKTIIHLIRLVVVATALIVSGTLSAAELYRWVDAEGLTHYGAQPPLGVKAEKIKTYGGGASSTSPYKAADETSDGAAGPASEEEAAALKAAEEQQRKQCAEMRSRLSSLAKPGRIRMQMNDGSQRFLSQIEIEKEKRSTREYINQTCAGY